MIKLTPRLQAIADRVPTGIRVADIGTDHAYLPAWLVAEGRCPGAWAADIQKGPLDNARETLLRENLEGAIELRLGPGLVPLRGETPQGIIIAGMGGILISEILEADLAMARKAERLILQPMSGFTELRRWLVTHGFRIVDECLAKEDRRIYEIICAQAGESQPPDDFMDLVGYCLPQSGDPLFLEFISNQTRRFQKIIREAGAGSGTDQLIRHCEQTLIKLKEVAACASTHEKSLK